MATPTSRLNMVTRMGSRIEVADFVTVAKWFAKQHLAHVPPIAAGQTTSSEPRHQPAVAQGVSEATWPRPSTANDSRLTRVSDVAPGSLASEQSRINGQAPPSWANRVDLDAIDWSDEPYHRYHAMLLCRNLQLAVDNDTGGCWAHLGEWMQDASANAPLPDLIRLLALVYLQRGEPRAS